MARVTRHEPVAPTTLTHDPYSDFLRSRRIWQKKVNTSSKKEGRVGLKVGQIESKGDNLGLFKISFQYKMV